MNLWDILVIVYLFEEFGCIKYVENSRTMMYNEIQIPGESPKKLKQIKHAYEKALDSINYRSSIVEPLRIKAAKRKNKFKQHTQTPFTNVRPEHGRKSKRLWDKAKAAEEKYQIVKHVYDRGLFCYPPLSTRICTDVFRNSYFKEENLWFRPPISHPGKGCIQVINTVEIDHAYEVEYMMEYSWCFANKKNSDGTESALLVYLETASSQPYFGGYKYFVLFLYLFDETTQKWVRPPDPLDPTNIDKGKFRYEAYLSL